MQIFMICCSCLLGLNATFRLLPLFILKFKHLRFEVCQHAYVITLVLQLLLIQQSRFITDNILIAMLVVLLLKSALEYKKTLRLGGFTVITV